MACVQRMKINDKKCIEKFSKYNNRAIYKALYNKLKYKTRAFLFKYKLF